MISTSYTVTCQGPSPMAPKHQRPTPLRIEKSFTPKDNDDPLSSPRFQRASTTPNITLSKILTIGQQMASKIPEEPESADAFDNTHNNDTPVEVQPRGSVDLDDLPIELISLTDSFIENLTTKKQPAPPDIDNVSRMFQDFYHQAAQHINTHINTLISRHRREASPPPTTPRSSAASILRAKAASIGKERQKAGTPRTEQPQQQMITAEELAERKRKRRAIERQRGALEEAVERRLCEGIYAKIYRHRSTQDEAADDMLRSKTAALAVVGIGLADLGVQLTEPSEPPEAQAEKAEEVRKWLDGARRELVAMNESRYPMGKLNHLKTAHKSIVDTLTNFHPSSSADEIMPMLIYTLITLPPASLNVISDLRFIERFRWEPKLTGEAAYCLTNLEAAIGFLETVDLSTLRADEAPSGPMRSLQGISRAETFPPAFSPTRSTTTTNTADHEAAGDARGPSPSSVDRLRVMQERNRRFSDLVNTPAQALGAAGDTLRNTADQGLKTISNSLGDSYKFLMGKLREPDHATGAEVVVPKTLEDARKLIGTPPPPPEGGGEDDVSVTSSDNNNNNNNNNNADNARPRAGPRGEDKVLHLISGRKPVRDHSADSSRSASSSTKPLSGLFGETPEKNGAGSMPGGSTAPPAAAAALESMRSFGNSLPAMSKFASGVTIGIGSFRPFGRSASQPATPQQATHAAAAQSATTAAAAAAAAAAEGVVDLATAFPDLAATLPPKEPPPKINPPCARFMEMQNPADLRIGEVLELLRDYRRLAGALKEREAFKG